MMLYKRLSQAVEGVKSDLWMKKAITGPYGNVREITGKNIGIIGLGRVGSNVARILSSFNCKTLGYDSSSNDLSF